MESYKSRTKKRFRDYNKNAIIANRPYIILGVFMLLLLVSDTTFIYWL